jgi:hypothetical protein
MTHLVCPGHVDFYSISNLLVLVNRWMKLAIQNEVVGVVDTAEGTIDPPQVAVVADGVGMAVAAPGVVNSGGVGMAVLNLGTAAMGVLNPHKPRG